jgi:hypothetical protein
MALTRRGESRCVESVPRTRHSYHPTNAVAVVIRRIKAYCIWFGLSVAIFQSGILRAMDDMVVVKGEYTEQTPRPLLAFDREAFSHGTFQIAIDANCWRIAYDDLSAPTNSRVMYSSAEAGCDGTNIYVVHKVNSALRDPMGNAPGSNFYWRAAELYAGVNPPSSEPFIYNLWLAFLSSAELTNETGHTKPWMETDLSMFYNSNYFCIYKWIPKDGSASVRRLELKSNGEWFQRDRFKNGKLGFIRLFPPFQDGFTMGTATWGLETNLPSGSFPLKYDFSAYSLKSQATNSQDANLAYTFSCDVQSVTTEPPIPHLSLDAIEEETYVKDHRFADKGYGTLTYAVTNHWLSPTNSHFGEICSRERKISLEDEALIKLGYTVTPSFLGIPPRSIIKGAILLMFILPLAFLIAKGFRNHKPKIQRYA